MQYEFDHSFPYPNSSGLYLTGDERGTLNDLSDHGDLITWRIFYGNSYLDATPQWYFLVRFSEDGTLYQDYNK